MNKEKIKEYLRKNEVSEKDINEFLEDVDSDVKYIVFEDYNFPDLHWRLYREEITYAGIIKDYFSDCEGSEDVLIYDAKEDKFYGVGLYDAKEDKFYGVGLIKPTIHKQEIE